MTIDQFKLLHSEIMMYFQCIEFDLKRIYSGMSSEDFDDEMDNCYLFEQAGKQVSIKNAGRWYATMPKEELRQLMEREPGLRQDWDEKYGDRMQKIVFIGQKLDKKFIKSELDKCLTDR